MGCGWCGCFCAHFFFYKQKTAYVMRISDWSSDVCSSDLVLGRDAGLGGGHPLAFPVSPDIHGSGSIGSPLWRSSTYSSGSPPPPPGCRDRIDRKSVV